MNTKDIVVEPIEASAPRDSGPDHDVDWDLAAGGAEDDLLDLVRERLDLADEISDMTIASSLAAIAVHDQQQDRWLAAVGSPLGKRLTLRGGDSNAALILLVSLSQTRIS